MYQLLQQINAEPAILVASLGVIATAEPNMIITPYHRTISVLCVSQYKSTVVLKH